MSTESSAILLVEDDHLLRHAFRLLLEDAGYRVLEASNAAEAIAVAHEDAPALILLDLGLPDRPGLEVVRELKSQQATRSIPVVALTGRAGPAERRACMDAGCAHYFSKPLEPRELLRFLPELLQ
ncbi:MAG TPA: response regulator [Longimicrobiales bacterium]|nr:response regulator [Longimicrobiales bacterium]